MPRSPQVPTALLAALAALGCGNPGPPAPPSLLLPQPVGDLTAERTADAVTLHWTSPARSTDRVPLRGQRRVALCRALEDGACEPAGFATLAANAPGAYTDVLPPELRAGPPRLLRYQVRLANSRGADAGPSNPAYTAAGAAPPALREAHAQPTARGIRVEWTAEAGAEPATPATAKRFARLERRAIEMAEAAREPGQTAGVQVLEAKESSGWAPGEALDSAAALNRRYSYRVALVEQLDLLGHSVEVDGLGATTPAFAARDTFPPSAPEGLQAVANPEGHAIDLSWTANPEPDLAGYVVYRRLSEGQHTPERVSGAQLLPGPAWTDPGAKPGLRYRYSVTAVDTSGNQSARSAERSEALP